MTKNIYDFFDDIVCINLDISQDRRKHAQHYFDKLGIPGRFFTATKHPKGGMYGCFDSHIQILQEAYDKSLNNILVFEDDFLPTASYSDEKMQVAIDFMKSNDDWDVFHFGYSFLKDDIHGFSTILSGKMINKDIVQYNTFLTQALCYNKKTIKTIIENYKEYIGQMHYDAFLSSQMNLCNYCIVPMMFDQNFNFQHNNQSMDAVEFILRSCFPILAISKLNYRATLLKYYMNTYPQYSYYIYIIMFCILIYIMKASLVKTKHKLLA
jgi:GR25 family glycosyltransferase involved in LPS biosynthesis